MTCMVADIAVENPSVLVASLAVWAPEAST